MERLKKDPSSFCVELTSPQDEYVLRHKNVESWASVLNAQGLLAAFTYHLKPILLNIHLVHPNDDEEELIFRSLVSILSEIHRAFERLNVFFDIPYGDTVHFHDGVHLISQLINKQATNPRSIYSCFRIRIS